VLLIVSTVVYYLPMLPFLKYEYFRVDVLNSGLASRIFEPGMDIGLGDRVLVVPLILGILVLVAISKKIGKSISGVAKLLGAANLIILGFIHFHPQWLIWVAPFLAIYVAKKKKELFSLILLFGVMIGVILLFDDKFLYWGLLSPLNNGLLNLPLIRDVLFDKGINVILLSNLLHSLAAVIGGYWFWKVVSEKNN